MTVPTFEEILNDFRSFLLLADEEYIRLTYATVIGNQMPTSRPIWLMLVAPPSSGKTTALNALNNLELVNPQTHEVFKPCHNISDLTENSFASGMSRGDKQTSLLHKIPRGGVMVYKDFTSIISKRQESRMVIMGQLREIYDGAYVKRTGTGEDILWQGKIGAIAGVTETIYEYTSSMSAMGDRFIMYQIPQPDKKTAMRFKIDQSMLGVSEQSTMPIIQQKTAAYLQNAINNLDDLDFDFPKDREDEIIDVATFCSTARSGIIFDEFRQTAKYVPEPEMPFRMFEQMMAIAKSLVFMRRLDKPEERKQLSEQDITTIYKIAFDSIPITRRIALRYLTIYDAVETATLARKLQYETPVVFRWLLELNGLGLVDRNESLRGANTWRIREEHRATVQRLAKTKSLGVVLESTEKYSGDEIDRHWELDKKAERALAVDDIQESIDNEAW